MKIYLIRHGEPDYSFIKNAVEKLGLPAEPFKNVQYYYPYSIPKTRHWNTYMTPEEVEDNVKKKKVIF